MEKNAVTLRIPKECALPEKGVWTNRFEIQSETSDRIYVVAQHKEKRHWGCSCPAYITRRYCKHLRALGIPAHEKPFEPNLITE